MTDVPIDADDVDDIRIRRAMFTDERAVLALVPRLVAFGPPLWRDAAGMSVTDHKVIVNALKSETDDPIVLVAEAGPNDVAGFIHLHSLVDYYTERKHGHVADIVVAEHAEGRGIARHLLSAGEDWARDQGYDWLTISVFEENARAAQLYERVGFSRDIIRLLKPLR